MTNRPAVVEQLLRLDAAAKLGHDTVVERVSLDVTDAPTDEERSAATALRREMTPDEVADAAGRWLRSAPLPGPRLSIVRPRR